jgi:GT2 family glycosyltransferase
VTDDLRIWVGLLDLDESDPVALTGPARAGYAEARILTRVHRAPIGYVQIAMQPEGTLAQRARAAADEQLADSVQLHLRRDSESEKMADLADWVARVTCPQASALDVGAGAGVSIIVCTRGRPAILRECLEALQKVSYEPIEILVVDNAPPDDATKDIVGAFLQIDPRMRYTCEPRPGLSRARNHGVAEAKFDILAFTDDDIVVDPGWPAALAAGFAADVGAACITGLVAARSLETASERYFDSRYSWGEVFEPRRYDLLEHRDQSRLYPFSAGIFGTGANFAVRREVVERLGGFDPLLGAGAPGRGGEDLDMFLRIILAGCRLCYLPGALVWHRHRADNDALAEQIYSYGYGLGAYLAKRLKTHEMSPTFLARGFGKSAEVAARMRQASQASKFKARGKRLAMAEALGVMAGALCYYRLARQSRYQ